MKRQGVPLFFIHLLLLFVVTATLVAVHQAIAERSEVVWKSQTTERSEQVEVISILGYVEVRKNRQNYWEVAKKNMSLSAEDLVRIPPKATLRVRLENGNAVYFVPGQEELVKDLALTEKRRIIDGRARSSKAKDMSRRRIRLTRTSAPKRKTNANYPSHNIACAQSCFDKLIIKLSNNERPPEKRDVQVLETRQSNDLDFIRLYLDLLKDAGVEAKPRSDNNTALFIVFNSGIAADEAQSITVNKKLYLVENDIIWLPLQITPSTDNFIKAWYKGSEIYLKYK